MIKKNINELEILNYNHQFKEYYKICNYEKELNQHILLEIYQYNFFMINKIKY